MNIRQKIQVLLLLLLTFFAFASYHESNGGTGWLQWTSLVAIFFFVFIFDLMFTSQSMFVFDPDAENWRRKTVRINIYYMLLLNCRGRTCCRHEDTSQRAPLIALVVSPSQLLVSHAIYFFTVRLICSWH
jgi:hypothetical protein